jgi:hypothetical protein
MPQSTDLVVSEFSFPPTIQLVSKTNTFCIENELVRMYFDAIIL